MPGAIVIRIVSQLTPSTHVLSVAEWLAAVAVPVQLPANGAVGPVGVKVADGGLAACSEPADSSAQAANARRKRGATNQNDLRPKIM